MLNLYNDPNKTTDKFKALLEEIGKKNETESIFMDKRKGGFDRILMFGFYLPICLYFGINIVYIVIGFVNLIRFLCSDDAPTPFMLKSILKKKKKITYKMCEELNKSRGDSALSST